MVTIKSYTDISQSRKLAEFLPLESADMFWYKDAVTKEANPRIMNYMQVPELQSIYYSPCWSLAALLSVLPNGVNSPFGEINPFVGQVGVKDYRCVYLDGDWDSNVQTFADNPVDACYELILKLNELNLL